MLIIFAAGLSLGIALLTLRELSDARSQATGPVIHVHVQSVRGDAVERALPPISLPSTTPVTAHLTSARAPRVIDAEADVPLPPVKKVRSLPPPGRGALIDVEA